MPDAPPPILPGTKVGDLLRDRPELEEALLGLSPAFAKLTNPILRRTVARVATLATAAKIAGMPVGELVDALRAAAGEPPLSESSGDGAAAADRTDPLPGAVVATVDADAMLDAGVHPLATVQSRAAALGSGEILLVRSSFRPEPLIEALAAAGHPVRVRPAGDGGFEVEFGPAGLTGSSGSRPGR